MPRSGRRQSHIQRGASQVVVIVIVLLVVVAGLVAWAIWTSHQSTSQTTAADDSGQANFKTPEIPQSEFRVECHGNGQPTVASTQLAPEIKKFEVTFKPLQPLNCQAPSGKTCKQQVWEVVANQDWVQDQDPRSEKQHSSYPLGTLVCPCSCSDVKILNLEWNDFERRPYPNGERATYYNVRFKLTDPATKTELATWTAWVRVPGGHTHYGDLGLKQIQIDLDRCPPSNNRLVECAKRASGQEFAQPPAGPPVG